MTGISATKRILLHGCYANRNFGDLLMLDMLTMKIQEAFNVTPVCPWVRRDRRKFVAAKSGHGLIDCLFADAAVFGGGGYIHHKAGVSLKGLRRYSTPAKIWSVRSIPYAVIGVGAGPEISPEARDHVRRIFDGAEVITVRDDESRDLIASTGVPLDRIRETADIVLGLEAGRIPPTAMETANRLLGKKQAGVRRLGLHFETLRKQPEKLAVIARTVAAALSKYDDIEPVWFFDHDRRMVEQMSALSREYLPNARVIPCQDHWTTAALIAGFDAVITTKLHVGIAAWALGVPSAGYSMHSKTARFYRQVGRSAFQCEDSGDPDIIASWIELFAQDNSDFMTLDGEIDKHVRCLALENMTTMEDFLRQALFAS